MTTTAERPALKGSVAMGSRPWLPLLLAWAVATAWVGSFILPSEEAVKVRNALVYRIGVPADFKWTPEQTPESFRENHAATPARLAELSRGLLKQDADEPQGIHVAGAKEFNWALAASLKLGSAQRRGATPVQSDTMTAYEAITERGQGYCADFTQVFQGMAFAANVVAREWGISFHGFGAGHAFVEVYDTGLGKWVMVDPFHSIYFVSTESRAPLSVLEVHDALLGLDKSTQVEVVKITPRLFPFRSEEVALDYYRRGMPQLALVWGNNVLDYDLATPVRVGSVLGRYAEQTFAIVTGWFPQYKIYPVAMSDRDFREMHRTLWSFIAAAISLALSTVLLLGQAVSALRAARRSIRTT